MPRRSVIALMNGPACVIGGTVHLFWSRVSSFSTPLFVKRLWWYVSITDPRVSQIASLTEIVIIHKARCCMPLGTDLRKSASAKNRLKTDSRVTTMLSASSLAAATFSWSFKDRNPAIVTSAWTKLSGGNTMSSCAESQQHWNPSANDGIWVNRAPLQPCLEVPFTSTS